MVHPGDDAGDAELLLGEEGHHEVVLVVAGRRDQHLALLEARFPERRDLARVADVPLDT